MSTLTTDLNADLPAPTSGRKNGRGVVPLPGSHMQFPPEETWMVDIVLKMVATDCALVMVEDSLSLSGGTPAAVTWPASFVDHSE